MLFNSPIFIFGFLPITLIGFFLFARFGQTLALAWLAVASVVFYGWWNPKWVPLLLLSIVFNLGAARLIARARDNPIRPAGAKWLLTIAVTTDLLLLAYYKYAAFLSHNLAALLGTDIEFSAGELPLGISFFTFTQIAFLVDVYQRKAADFHPVRYGLFVTYFPHLIAGPILHHKEMMPQFAQRGILRFDPARLADGLVIFTLGLFKKVVLADQFGAYASPGFAAAASQSLSLYASWGAVLSYTLQIYFDFSGYSDMAIGLARMIGVELPLNFHSPYKALSISDFWRRWHMTLSRFLRDYLYIPLGGNRHGEARRYVNLMLTMLLGGLWHGAGWTFVVWGAWHGLLLALQHAWTRIAGALKLQVPAGAAVPLRILGWALTFLVVVIGWVFFRAPNMASAWAMLGAMVGHHGAYLPDQLLSMAPPLRHIAQGAGTVPYLADGTVMGLVEMAGMLGLGTVLVLATPAIHELQERTRYWLVVPCAALVLQRVLYGTHSEFLYFQF